MGSEYTTTHDSAEVTGETATAKLLTVNDFCQTDQEC